MRKLYILLSIILIATTAISQSFEEITGTPFEGVGNSSIAFADIDNDNDQDLLITGKSLSENGIAKLYTNDGSGNFTEVFDTPFIGVNSSSIAFADIENDGDQDLLITGWISPGRIAKLYTNDGNGVYAEVIGTPFVGVRSGSIAFADIDNDNDQDVLITGWISIPFQSIAKLYTNNGDGIFTEMTETPFEGVHYSSIAFADIDNDNDQDVLITGSSYNGNISKLYTNDGNGNFEELIGTPFEGVEYSSIAFADIDNDDDQDVLITGRNNSFQGIAKLYSNDGNGYFEEIMEAPFYEVTQSSIAFSDIDNDNDQDVLITGSYGILLTAKLYTNDGNGVYAEVIGTPFVGVNSGSIAFADIDNDNDQDILITGLRGSLIISKLYANNTIATEIFKKINFINTTSFFPNPATNEVFISSNTNSIINEVNIYNQLGQKVLHQQWPSNCVDVAMLKPGIYIIELLVGESLTRKKLIIK